MTAVPRRRIIRVWAFYQIMVQTWQGGQSPREGSLAELRAVRTIPKHIPAPPHLCLKGLQELSNDRVEAPHSFPDEELFSYRARRPVFFLLGILGNRRHWIKCSRRDLGSGRGRLAERMVRTTGPGHDLAGAAGQVLSTETDVIQPHRRLGPSRALRPGLLPLQGQQWHLGDFWTALGLWCGRAGPEPATVTDSPMRTELLSLFFPE